MKLKKLKNNWEPSHVSFTKNHGPHAPSDVVPIKCILCENSIRLFCAGCTLLGPVIYLSKQFFFLCLGGIPIAAKCLYCLCKGLKLLFTLKWLLKLWNITSLFGQRPYTNKSYTSLNYLMYYSRAWSFAFIKLEFNTIYYKDSNKSPFKHYISIPWEVGGLRQCLFCLFRGEGSRIRENLLIWYLHAP